MTPSLGAGAVVGVEKINWVAVNGFEISRWKVPQRWVVIIHVPLGFLCLLLPPSRVASLMVPQSEFYLDREPAFNWTDSSLGSLGRRLPGERDVILGTWLPCLISFRKDWFSQMPARPCSTRQPETKLSFSSSWNDKRGESLQILVLSVPPVGKTWA